MFDSPVCQSTNLSVYRLNDRRLKGKWLLDRRHGQVFANLNDVCAAMATYLDRRMMDDLRRVEPHGPFSGETVETL